jgi:hypothetical protein
MAIANMTTFDALLKEHYNRQMVENLVYKNNPFLAMVPKYEKFGGRSMPLPLVYGNPQNRSATFSTAVAATTSSSSEAFALTRVKNYSLAFIDGETLKASEGDANAFVSAATLEIDGAIQALSNDLAFSLARDSSGYRGQVLAEPSEAGTTVITLVNIKDIVGFEVGQSISIHSAKTGGSAKIYATGVSVGLISAINRSTGVLTIAAAYDTNGTIAANDYLFVTGDRGLKVSGLESWIPDSAPDNTSFFGVARDADVSRLGGVRTTGTGMPIEEALIQGAQDIAENGGMPDVCFLNYKQYAKLVKSLGSKVQFIDLEVNAAVGFRGVLIHGAHGPIKVVPDRTIRDSRAYMLQLDTWKLCSLGPAVQVLDADGQQMLRQSTADAFEVRVGSYLQLGCNAPGFNGVITLD